MKTIKCYDIKDNLQTFAEIDSNLEVASYYNLSNNIFTRFFKPSYDDDGKVFTENNKTKIEFEGECEMINLVFDGVSICRIKKHGYTQLTPPPIKSRIDMVDENYIESFTIKPELIQEWLKKI